MNGDRRIRARLTPLGQWIIEKFGGATPKESIVGYAERLAMKVNGKHLPVSLSSIAVALGVAPKPLFTPDSLRGSLTIVDKQLRIVIRSASGRPPNRKSSDFRRARFTYAHELAHSLLFNLSSIPPSRAAPIGNYREEEILCNAAASGFLVPTPLLSEFAQNEVQPTLTLLVEWAERFQVSLQAMSVACSAIFARTINDHEMYLLCNMSKGVRGIGAMKLRCMVCIMPSALLNRGVSFLKPYQGADRVSSCGDKEGKPWSLMDIATCEGMNNGDEVLFSDTVISPTGHVFAISGIHERYGSYIWTSAKIRHT